VPEKFEERVASQDGTVIGFVRLGTGTPHVIASGSRTTGNEWLPVASVLSDRFTCFLMDRRGRGRSEGSTRYSLDAECEDIEAVLERAGGDACLPGHSYGAICALEPASRRPLSKLVLYEPPLPMHPSTDESAFAEFKSAVEREDFDAALAIGCKRMMRMTDAEVAALRGSLMWRSMAALTPTWIRECEVVAELDAGVERYASVRTATLLLLGTATAQHHIDATRALASTLPRARLREIEGHGHHAHLTASRRVAAAVADFLADS